MQGRQKTWKQIIPYYFLKILIKNSAKYFQKGIREILCLLGVYLLCSQLPKNLESWENLEFDNLGENLSTNQKLLKKIEKPGILKSYT